MLDMQMKTRIVVMEPRATAPRLYHRVPQQAT
jgi:hypothetical protein